MLPSSTSPGDVLASTLTLGASGATVVIAAPDGSRMSSLAVPSPMGGAAPSWSDFIGSNFLLFEATAEAWNLTSPSQWPSELLAGWSVAASISPASGLTTEQWQLAPWDNPSMKVSCSYDASIYGSTCSWAR